MRKRVVDGLCVTVDGTETGEREVDDTRMLVGRPADRVRNRARFEGVAAAAYACDEQPRVGCDPVDPLSVAVDRADQARNRGAVRAFGVQRLAAPEPPRADDPAGEVRVFPIDARVDDRDLHRCERGQRGRSADRREIRLRERGDRACGVRGRSGGREQHRQDDAGLGEASKP